MLPPGKEKQMVFKIILIIIAFVMLCGIVADESRYNKRTYCSGDGCGVLIKHGEIIRKFVDAGTAERYMTKAFHIYVQNVGQRLENLHQQFYR